MIERIFLFHFQLISSINNPRSFYFPIVYIVRGIQRKTSLDIIGKDENLRH